MSYLFDTDVLSATLRRTPDVGVIRRLAAVPADEQFTSAVTLAELVFGAVRRDRAMAEPDLRIAAIALSCDLTLVTSNERHFTRVPGLAVEDWLTQHG